MFIQETPGFLKEYIEQFQKNKFVKLGTLLGFTLFVWMFSKSIFTTLVVVIAIALGRLSKYDAIDDMEI